MPSRLDKIRMSYSGWLRDRELGHKKFLGFDDHFYEKVYRNFQSFTSWNQQNDRIHGGIFNLEFSQNGDLLVAACEKKSILLFDPLNRELIKSVENAHGDCVNYVRFLDSRTFATCSDDKTVALWDVRMLNHKTRSLIGHSNWVKNIEYSPKDDLLVTSGFDGSIYTWDINSYTENSLTFKRVFHTNGLMRTRLTPNASKMIICTTSGYLILIHDLNLKTLAQDFQGFRPNMYRLMQRSSQTIPAASAFTYLFSPGRKSNRVEFITDFPPTDKADVISSLQIHPMGWCCLSRNVTVGECDEWTCVHDIQEKTAAEIEQFYAELKKSEAASASGEGGGSEGAGSTGDAASITPPPSTFAHECVEDASMRRCRDMPAPTTDVWEALIAIREARLRRELGVRISGTTRFNFNNMQRITNTSTGILGPNSTYYDYINDVEHSESPSVSESNVASTSSSTSRDSSNASCDQSPKKPVRRNRRLPAIYKNIPRLTHFIEETNTGKGFIKEQCFSPDGRVICSPFGYGVRLLAFSPQCHELSTCVPDNGAAIPLVEIGTNICHSDIVLTSKFSPKHCLLVTGCLSGNIVWQQPLL